MKKIPTLFVRDPEDRAHVLPEITPGCEWVLEAPRNTVRSTRKYDGTCTFFDGQDWFARREVKPGKTPPLNWVQVDTDEVTGKSVGWEPIEQSSFAKFHADALRSAGRRVFDIGTYELFGVRINGNPETISDHRLVAHADAEYINLPDRAYDGIRETLLLLKRFRNVEGIVFHHIDGRMAKIKAKDFRVDAS